MNITDLEAIEPLAYTYAYGGRMYFLIPTAITETQSTQAIPYVCPIAQARGSMAYGSFDEVMRLVRDQDEVVACFQCEGMWIKTKQRINHISGESIARYRHAAEPMHNAMIIDRIRSSGEQDAA